MSADPSSFEPLTDRNAEFVQLLTASHGRLFGYLLSLLGRRADAEDVLQRASLLMWQKFEDFESGTDFMAWASTICFYEARNFQRLAAHSTLHFDEELMDTLSRERLVDLSHRDHRLQALNGCVSKLAKPDQALVRAFYQENVQVADLAREMNRATQTIYNKLNVIRRLLADCVRRTVAEENA